MDPRVFSRFTHTFDCGNGQTSEQVTWIEPLSHGLRHPHALCQGQMDITAIMDRRYLLLAHQAEHAAATRLGNTRCRDRRCQTIYFDLGATTLQPTPDEAGQGWFYSAYRRQGFHFDRFLLWEAKTQDPAEVFKHVPKADLHKYQYFNVPVTPDTSDPSNPVNILKVCTRSFSALLGLPLTGLVGEPCAQLPVAACAARGMWCATVTSRQFKAHGQSILCH